jgi:hypothetical protein
MDTVIMRCTCKHAFQDQRYGAQMRVHNVMAGKTTTVRARCTICCTVRDVVQQQPVLRVVDKKGQKKPLAGVKLAKAS